MFETVSTNGQVSGIDLRDNILGNVFQAEFANVAG
jgi:hypothetical protein